MIATKRTTFLLAMSREELRRLFLLMTFHPMYKSEISEELVNSRIFSEDYDKQYKQFSLKWWTKSLVANGFTPTDDPDGVVNLVAKTKAVLAESSDWIADQSEAIVKSALVTLAESKRLQKEQAAQVRQEKKEREKQAVKNFWKIINHSPGWIIRHKSAGETIVTEHAWKRFVGRCFGDKEKVEVAEHDAEFYKQQLREMFQRAKPVQWDPETRRKIILHNLDEGRHWTDYYLDDQTLWLFPIVRADRLEDQKKKVMLTVFKYHPETQTISE